MSGMFLRNSLAELPLLRQLSALHHFICFFFFFNDPAPTKIYTVRNTLSLHDALPISKPSATRRCCRASSISSASSPCSGRTSRSEEHTSELQSLRTISYAVFCLKKKKYTQELDSSPSISQK